MNELTLMWVNADTNERSQGSGPVMGLRHYGSGQIWYHFKHSCASCTAHRTACNNEQVPGSMGADMAPHFPHTRTSAAGCCCRRSQPDAARRVGRASRLIRTIRITTNRGHLPEILVHRFEEEFVAVDRPIVEDIFKIR